MFVVKNFKDNSGKVDNFVYVDYIENFSSNHSELSKTKENHYKYLGTRLLQIAQKRSSEEKMCNGKLRLVTLPDAREYYLKKFGFEVCENVSNDNLFNLQAEVIKELAIEEDCVSIGRCADYVLKDNPNVISLYCYAPLEDCIKREKKRSGADDKEIIKKIHKIDKNRAAYYTYYTGKEWNDARNYDLCLNTASMSYEELVGVARTYIEVYAKEK